MAEFTDAAQFVINSNLAQQFKASDGPQKAIKVIAFYVEREAKKRAPVDTGRLRASIATRFHDEGDGTVSAVVGTNVHYAPHVEFGTVKTPAQPFLRPALVAAKVKFTGKAF